MAKKKSSGSIDGNEASPTFEQAAARLDQIVDKLETGNLDLNQSLSTYEEGVNLLKQCNQLLRKAEQKIELLISVDQTGNIKTETFDDRATEMDETGKSRARKRSSTNVDSESSLF